MRSIGGGGHRTFPKHGLNMILDFLTLRSVSGVMRSCSAKFGAILMVLAVGAAPPGSSQELPPELPPDLLTPVFDEAEIRWDPELTDGAQAAGYTIYDEGHSVQRTLEMPRLPADHRDTQRIIATLIVEPVLIEEEGKIRPGDPWTR